MQADLLRLILVAGARALERRRMVIWRVAALFAIAAATAGCFEKITAPPCSPMLYTPTDTTGDTITTSRGLRYIEVLTGTGAPLTWCTAVTVDYDAYLVDSTKFNSSRDLGVPLHFVPGLGDLIDGFEQGVIGMQNTGKRRLIIPPELGYGSQPVRDKDGTIIVPANSTLIFDIEVIAIGP
jgi:FKBP-type peptidyl-prolyl cis-trans isomerase